MSRTIRIAAAQMGAIQKNDSRAVVVSRMVALITQAHARGANLIVFPELTLTTFFPRWSENLSVAIERWFEHEMPNDATAPLFEMAQRYQMAMSFGYAELTPDGHRYNTSILVNKTGAIVGKYRKIHLPGTYEPVAGRDPQQLEKKYFEVGNLGFRVWRFMDGIFGMCICNDRRWPEAYRVMGLQGVEMILLGYNTPTKNSFGLEESAASRMFQNHICMQANAYQNSTWVIGVAKAGIEDGYELMAGTAIIRPNGEIAAVAVTTEDELIVHDCDLDEAQILKKTLFDFDKNRRIEHYGIITSQVGVVPPPL
jgi:N-carbamoyl-D-amino-acid hydrolase